MCVLRVVLCQLAVCGMTVAQVDSGYRVRTFAGGGLPDGIPALSASLGTPYGLAVDSAGNVYLASEEISAVFRLDASGKLTRVAGTGAVGFSGDGGPAANAELSYYDTVAVTPDGALYIADFWNGRIRKVANGVITTVAGGGFQTGDGGPATSAWLSTPTGIAIDSGGNLYFAERDGNRVRRVSNGIITTIAGNGIAGFGGDGGPAVNAMLYLPTGIAVDSAGNVYIADTVNYRVRMVSGGVITTVAGTGTSGHSGDNGPAGKAQLSLNGCSSLAVDAAGDLYIPDWIYIREVSNGMITTVAGIGPQPGDVLVTSTPALIFPLNLSPGVALDSAGNLFIADYGWIGEHGGVVVEVSHGQATIIAGGGSAIGDGGPTGAGQLYHPSGIALDRSGTLYTSDTGNDRVRAVKGGILTTVAGTGTEMYEGNGEGGPATAAIIMNPAAVTADTLGNFYFVDEGPYLRKVSQGILTTIGEIAPGLLVFTQAAKIISPSGSGVILGLAASSTGDVYFTETLDHTVHKLSGGAITVVAGTGKAGYSGDNGPAQNAQLNSPAGLAVDDADNLYIADQNNGAIRKVANGTITTVAAPFEEPSQVAVDREGNVFVIDGMAVLKASDGVITTLVEGITAPEYGRVAPRAQLGHPNGLAVDRAGCVYVSDSLNNRILVLIPPPGGAPSVHPDGRLPGSTVDLRSACAAAAMQ